MSRDVGRFRTGNYTGTISINKNKLEYTLELGFRSGAIIGKGIHETGEFSVSGSYNPKSPYGVNFKLEKAFGYPEVSLEGFHYADGTIFGSWSTPGGVKAGDFQWKYKDETPEEKEIKRMRKIEAAVNTIVSMGFAKDVAYKALDVTNGNVDLALEQLMNGEVVSNSSNFTDAAPSEPLIKQLVEMGFLREQAIQALKVNGNNMAPAIDWLFAGNV